MLRQTASKFVGSQQRTASLSSAPAPAISSYGTGRRFCCANPVRSALRLAADEGFGLRQCLIIGELLWRALHVIARRSGECAADLAIERQLGTADRVDDDAGGIRRIPHFKLQFKIERHVTKSGAFESDVAPLPVAEPRHVITRADMRVVV